MSLKIIFSTLINVSEKENKTLTIVIHLYKKKNVILNTLINNFTMESNAERLGDIVADHKELEQEELFLTTLLSKIDKQIHALQV